MKALRVLLVLLLSPCVVGADTIIVGGHLPNQTWTLANSPYIVQGDVTIPSGNFLTIQPGVEVRFSSFDSQFGGLDPNRVELTVRGTLTASGTAELPIVFKAQTGIGPSRWYGIILTSTTAEATTFSRATIRDAIYAIRSQATASVLDMAHVVLSQNQYGVFWSAGLPTFENLKVFGNVTGLLAQSGGLVRNCLIYNNTTYGVQLAANNLSPLTVVSCTLDSNGTYGLYASGPGIFNVEDCIVANHTFGVHQSGSAPEVNVTYCDVWNPTGVDFFDVTPGAGVISEDPLFASRKGADNVAGTEDDSFQILYPSPCIDAGSDVSGFPGYDEASIPNTGKDGSSNDIGRDEYIPELRILKVEISTNDVRVHFVALTNKTYQLEASTNLSSDPADWFPVGSAVPGIGLIVEQTDPGAAQQPMRFYRLREF